MTEKFKEFHKFYIECKKLSFLDFEELISNSKDEEEKIFYSTILQYFMEKNFKKVLESERYWIGDKKS